MPHAALWVVQHLCETYWCGAASVSMPHAALWVVQPALELSIVDELMGFNAARGFVGGAAPRPRTKTYRYRVSMPHAALWVVQQRKYQHKLYASKVSMPHAAIPFRPHHRFAVPLPRSRRGGLVRFRFLAESRNISFPRRCGGAVNVCQSHFVLLVFLGRFPIRPVSRSAVPYGLASRTGQ